MCLRYLSCWGLHCASTFGIAESAACSLEVGGRNINQNDSMGDAPLAWAAANRHEGVVKIRLRRDDINPDKPGKDDQTPHYSLLAIGMRERRKYYSDGTTSIPTNQMSMAEHHSGGLLGIGTRAW